MIDVVPVIIPDSFETLSEKTERVKELVPRIQIDIANGSYAPTKTWPYTHDEHLAQLLAQDEGLPYWEDLSYEVDMLIANPEDVLEQWIDIGVDAVIIHIESTSEHSLIFQKARERNVEIGWALKPGTPNQKLFDIIESVGMPNFIQVMGNNNIGHSGVPLDEVVYEKIADIRATYPELPIAVDIGVNEDTATALIDAGATKLVAGSAIFEALDAREAIEHLENL
ncbi:MAG: tryptophan synthase subunit alpha [Candidatus Pacebacteria bacterium]|nr:tryptophan synthase subunit alpha [Candidatus Paceibacterota bacterium]